MRDGFVKVAAATPVIKLGNCKENAKEIIKLINQAEELGVKVLGFPELCLTGFSCGDLFLQDTLIKSAEKELLNIVEATRGLDVLSVVSLPVEVGFKLYLCAAVIQNGQLLGLVPKCNLVDYGGDCESRYFVPGTAAADFIEFADMEVTFAAKQIFRCSEYPALSVAVEICEDLWVPAAPSIRHACAGATVIVNPATSCEQAGKRKIRRDLVGALSARTHSAYVYASSGEGESTTDMCFSGHRIIADDGDIIAESDAYTAGLTVSEVDVNALCIERRQQTSYKAGDDGYIINEFSLESATEELPETVLTRHIAKKPFLPEEVQAKEEALNEYFDIQVHALMSRLSAINCKSAVIGISGGLDSTLAVLVTAEAFKKLGLDPAGIIAVTMPCFGTSKRTYNNAQVLVRELGIKLLEINIKDAVLKHFADIGQDPENHDVTFENAQARERTEILMDMANMHNGIVVGTGDLSELALGFATYNGDHMAMYGVNASVPKTVIREIVKNIALKSSSEALKDTLLDILGTPVSPELLPATAEGLSGQVTEDIVGPYELHDFFIYYMVHCGFTPAKIFRLAMTAFAGEYDKATILKWMKMFYRRFFAQQFKRSCMPDGPLAGPVSLSPRGAWHMPSDIRGTAWLEEIEALED